ncbi:hypothetical protein X801_09782 [Opisthorchis viverrini]|uniref:Uncharacterized protein n=1 Tax=Opisthorchis viverrini TaxID=6198 RepID=A0A1S8WJ15_OPIVI|nr:hypothetical protein X801_09782 [Opisthorchis viverrini]
MYKRWPSDLSLSIHSDRISYKTVIETAKRKFIIHKAVECIAWDLLSSPRIKRFSMYLNESIPAEWHSGGTLFPPILLVAKPGFVFISEFWPLDLSHTNLSSLKGAHGYDTTHPDMHVPLFLFGPRIKPSSLYRDLF